MQRGFTLVDMMIVIAVVTIIASIAIPSIENTRRDENTMICLQHQEAISRWIADFVNQKQDELGAQRDKIQAAVEEYIAARLTANPSQRTSFVPVGGGLEDSATVPNAATLIAAGYSASLFVNSYAGEGALPGTGFTLVVTRKIVEGRTVYDVRVNSTANYKIGPSGGFLSSDDTRPNARELIAFGAPEGIFVCPERADKKEPIGFHYTLKGVTGDVECTTDLKGEHRDPNAQYVHSLD
ncbi:MAG: prepilin-type N-terminal cleavage/methylation domain-containing protein [bacterium]|nr:prepilin-type N-terminal cleavage/methylation domain-containing protein [bacterium]